MAGATSQGLGQHVRPAIPPWVLIDRLLTAPAISAIPDVFRRTGFPIVAASKVPARSPLAPADSSGASIEWRMRFSSLDDTSSILKARSWTVASVHPGTMTVCVVRHDQSHSLPPRSHGRHADVTHPRRAWANGSRSSTLITTSKGRSDPDSGWVVGRARELHDHNVETFHDHVVTKDAIKQWNDTGSHRNPEWPALGRWTPDASRH